MQLSIVRSWTLNDLLITDSRNQTGIDVVSSTFVVGIRKCNFNGHALQEWSSGNLNLRFWYLSYSRPSSNPNNPVVILRFAILTPERLSR